MDKTLLDTMVEAVKAHAQANYERDGWDYVVECWDDAEIAATLREQGCTSVAQALRTVGKIVGVHDSVHRDIRGA